MIDDSIVTESLPRPEELSPCDGALGRDTNKSAEPEFIATDELKQLLDPVLDEAESRTDAGLQIEDEDQHDTDPGFDPYNRL